jgi:hypothetical protein
VILGLFRRASFWWAVFTAAVVLRTLHRPESHTVFPVFASGAEHWWADLPLYGDYRPTDFFRYPPLFAILFSPFAWLGPCAGGVLWSLTNLAVYWFGLRRFQRDVIGGTPSQLFLVLSLLGAAAGFWNAQSNALLVGLLLLGASAAARQRWWSAAFLLGLPVVFKFTPLPLVLLLCALWPRQLTGRVLAVCAVGFLLPFLTRPPDIAAAQYQGWVHHLAESSAERWPGFRDAWTVFAVTRHLAEGGEGMPDLEAAIDEPNYRLVQLLGGLSVLLWSQGLRWRGMDERRLVLLTLAGGAGWLLLLGPSAEPPTYVFLAPFLAWGIVERQRWPGVRWLIATAGALLLVLGWGGLTRPWWDAVPWLIFALPLGLMLFLVWLVLGPGCLWGSHSTDVTRAAHAHRRTLRTHAGEGESAVPTTPGSHYANWLA